MVTIGLIYLCGFIFTVLFTVDNIPVMSSIGASIWWPITWIWFIIYTGIKAFQYSWSLK